jgi:hypothetical protein
LEEWFGELLVDWKGLGAVWFGLRSAARSSRDWPICTGASGEGTSVEKT